MIQAAVATMKEHGAEIVELEIEGLEDLFANSSVIDIEFTTDVEAYLQASGAPVRTVEALLASGQYHEALEARYRRSLERAADAEEYERRLANRDVLATLLVETLEANDLDALVYPTLRVKPVFVGEGQYGSLCPVSAHSGLPAISVPAGFTPDGLPVGVELLARPFDDGRLIGLGYAWEQLASPRRPPERTPSLISAELSYEFEIDSEQIGGQLRLDRPTQALHYALEAKGIDPDEITELRLHRGGDGENGPVIELLGSGLEGSAPIRNEDFADLMGGRLYFVVYTRDEPQEAMRGQVRLRSLTP